MHFASVEHAIMTIRDLRKSMLYANTHINLHIAAGEYSRCSLRVRNFLTTWRYTVNNNNKLPTDNSLSGNHHQSVEVLPTKRVRDHFPLRLYPTNASSIWLMKNVKLVGIHFVGDQLTTNTDGGPSMSTGLMWRSIPAGLADSEPQHRLLTLLPLSFCQDKASTHQHR